MQAGEQGGSVKTDMLYLDGSSCSFAGKLAVIVNGKAIGLFPEPYFSKDVSRA